MFERETRRFASELAEAGCEIVYGGGAVGLMGAVADAALEAGGRATGINGVVTSWEFLSPLAIRLAADLGLPGHMVELADACRNKRIT